MTFKIDEMKERRAKAWEDAKAFLTSHTGEDGFLSAEDDAAYSAMEKKIDDYTKEISRMERVEQIDKQMSAATTTPITNTPVRGKKEKTGRASDEYKKALFDAMRSNFKHVSNVLQEGVDTDGGYLVPIETDERLIRALTADNIMRTLGTNIVTSGEHRINVASTEPAAAWLEEGGELTFSDASFSQILLDAHKLTVAVKVTEELLYDSMFDLETYLVDAFGKALSNAEEDAFLNGDGDGKPTGIFDTTGGGTAAGTLSAAIKADDVLELIYALNRPYRKNAAFIMSDPTLLSLRKLKDNNGAYMWQPSWQVGEPDRLLGYPVYTSPYAPDTGIAFGDFSYYNIGDRGVRSFAELRELFAGNGMIGFVAKERVDGKLVLPEAVQILTLSD